MKRFDGDYDLAYVSDDSRQKQKRLPVQRVKTTMLSRNINVLGHRTSVRLEKEMWDALKSIANREACSVHDICSLVFVRKREDTSLTAAIRVFVMLYFRAAANEKGHQDAGHGDFETMKRRAGIVGDFSELAVLYKSNLSRQQA